MRFCVKKSAEALKLHRGKEPTVNLVRQHCTKAAVNPDTGEYFGKKLILDVFKNECFDNGARLPWGHLSPVSQSALSPGQIASRRKYAKAEKGNSPPVPCPSSNYSLPYSTLYHGGMGRLGVAWGSVGSLGRPGEAWGIGGTLGLLPTDESQRKCLESKES